MVQMSQLSMWGGVVPPPKMNPQSVMTGPVFFIIAHGHCAIVSFPGYAHLLGARSICNAVLPVLRRGRLIFLDNWPP